MVPWFPLYYEEPLEIVSGEGCTVTDADGASYLEFYAGIAVNTLGYKVPEVHEAVERQLRKGVVHTSTFYLIGRQVELAERIAALSGIPDPLVFFTCSGTEAVEAALLATTEYRQSSQIIALRYGYHGRSFGGLGVTGDRHWQGSGLSPVRVAHARGGERRRGGLSGLDDKAYVRACREDLEELVGTSTPERTAAMIVEPVQGIAGGIPLVPGQLAAYREVLDEYEIPLIVDEVQTGWGRTGKYWGYQWHQITPDVLVFAKGVGNGFTLGGLVGRRDIMSSLDAPSISSFGGNHLSTAAAVATLDYIAAHDLTTAARRLGAVLIDGLKESLDDEPCVSQVRGQGLLLGIEFSHPGTLKPFPEMAARVQQLCRENALLVGLGGTFGNCLRLSPPLTVQEDQVRLATRVIAASTRAARAD
ncbi:aspartate aminotransferase family protein [Streptomyces sp. NPDC056670]|uniref:aspartate aminotransferase family protein n=1 Tax=Streptomyces sp. NPDC056670 TaxID=3345904 RepID=UPI0036C9D5D4